MTDSPRWRHDPPRSYVREPESLEEIFGEPETLEEVFPDPHSFDAFEEPGPDKHVERPASEPEPLLLNGYGRLCLGVTEALASGSTSQQATGWRLLQQLIAHGKAKQYRPADGGIEVAFSLPLFAPSKPKVVASHYLVRVHFPNL
jgi:hypothetical protein